MLLTSGDFLFLAHFVEGFFFGVYSAIFVMHVQYHASTKGIDNAKQNIVLYALCVLYVLSAAVISLDIETTVIIAFNDSISTKEDYGLINIAQPILFGCCDFLAQSILIHRCWIVWGCNIRVVIIPSILAFGYLIMWMASICPQFIAHGEVYTTVWGYRLTLTSLTVSMAVNALVTSLIVVKIFKVFRGVKSSTTLDEKCLGVTRGKKLRSIIFIIIESGMTLFAIQLARLVSSILGLQIAFNFITGIHEMLNGITPTIILVRVSMGLSFHDESSLVEAVSSLRFGAADPIPRTASTSQDRSLCIEPHDLNAIPEMISIRKERRDNDIEGSDDIQMIDR